MHDEQVAGVAVQFHFAVERDACSGQEAIGQIAAVKPLGQQAFLGGIFKNGFEESQVAAAKSTQVSRLDLGDDGGHFAWSELSDGFDVAAVFIAEGSVGEKILNGDQTFAFKHPGARGSDAFDELERCGSVQRGDFLRLQVPVYNGDQKVAGNTAFSR